MTDEEIAMVDELAELTGYDKVWRFIYKWVMEKKAKIESWRFTMSEIKAILTDLEKLQGLMEEGRASTAELKRQVIEFQKLSDEVQRLVEEFLQSREKMRKDIEKIRQTVEDMRYRLEWEKIHFKILRAAALIRANRRRA